MEWLIAHKDIVSIIVQFSQAVILFVTAIVVGIYTYQTVQLRRGTEKQVETSIQQVKETQKQANLMIRPFLILYKAEYRSKILLKNIGNSAALNVKIKDIQVPSGSILRCNNNIDYLQEGYSVTLHLEHINKNYSAGDITSDLNSLLLDPKYYADLDATTEYGGEFSTVTITYCDVDLNSHYNLITIDSQGISVERSV